MRGYVTYQIWSLNFEGRKKKKNGLVQEDHEGQQSILEMQIASQSSGFLIRRISCLGKHEAVFPIFAKG